jgi:hypothetical protein
MMPTRPSGLKRNRRLQQNYSRLLDAAGTNRRHCGETVRITQIAAVDVSSF